MKIGIVIVNWNGWRDTIECIASLKKINYPNNWQITMAIVDNASTDDSLLSLKNEIQKNSVKDQEIILLESEKNRGFSGGNNMGIELLLGKKCNYILLLNNDTLVDKNFLTNLVVKAEQFNYQLSGPKIFFAPGYEYHKKYSAEQKGKVIWYAGGVIDWKNIYCFHRGIDEVDKKQFDDAQDTEFISGCCLLVKREVFENIGLLDDEYFLYLEDVDFCMRAKRVGYRLGFIPQSIIWHKNAQSSDKPGSKTHVYYQTRNRMLFGMKYASLRTKIALVRESFSFLRKGETRRKATLDFYLGHYGKRI